MDTNKRSILKSITFRIIASIVTMLTVLVFTKNLVVSGIIGVVDIVSKLIIYYLHERVWSRISWGVKSS